jgi:hypothetical protein
VPHSTGRMGMYEYTTEVFAVGLNGFAPVDNDRLNAMS